VAPGDPGIHDRDVGFATADDELAIQLEATTGERAALDDE
jgi:hypothetical protein